MAMKISVKMDGLDTLQAKLRGLSDKKIEVAAVAALNDAAFLGTKKTKAAIASVFDRPTPWVVNAVNYKKARIGKLEATIDFTPDINKQGVTVAKILDAEIHGGQRRHKRHEVALERAGVLPSGMYIVPGQAAQLDSYGNMSAGQIAQVLAWFRAKRDVGSTQNMTDATRAKRRKGTRNKAGFEYFVVNDGARRTWSRGDGKAQGSKKMMPGVYMRLFLGAGTMIKPVMIFVNKSVYRRRLDFYRIAEEAALSEFSRAYPMYLGKLLKERGL